MLSILLAYIFLQTKSWLPFLFGEVILEFLISAELFYGVLQFTLTIIHEKFSRIGREDIKMSVFISLSHFDGNCLQ